MKFTIEPFVLQQMKQRLDRRVKGRSYMLYATEAGVTLSTMGDLVYGQTFSEDIKVETPGRVTVTAEVFDVFPYIEEEIEVEVKEMIEIRKGWNGDLRLRDDDLNLLSEWKEPKTWHNIPPVNYLKYANDGEFPYVYIQDNVWAVGSRTTFAGLKSHESLGEHVVPLHMFTRDTTTIGFVDEMVWVYGDETYTATPEGSIFNKYIPKLAYYEVLGDIEVILPAEEVMHWLGLAEIISHRYELGRGIGRVTLNVKDGILSLLPDNGEVGSGEIPSIPVTHKGEFSFYTSTKYLRNALQNVDSETPTLNITKASDRIVAILLGNNTRHFIGGYN